MIVHFFQIWDESSALPQAFMQQSVEVWYRSGRVSKLLMLRQADNAD